MYLLKYPFTRFNAEFFPKKFQVSEEDEEYEDLHDGASFQIEQGNSNNIQLSSDIELPIKKIRDTAKMFRKSPVFNDHLQKRLLADPDHGKKRQLLLDVRTRWGWV